MQVRSWVAVLAGVLSVGVAHAQTSFNVDFESAPHTACGSLPGCTSFTVDAAGQPFVFAFTPTGDFGLMQWDTVNGENNSSAMACYSAVLQLATTERVTIRHQNNLPFNFNSLYIDNIAGETITVAGYRGGNVVGGSQFVTQGSYSTLNFDGIQVDEIRLTSLDFYGTYFDSFKGSIAVANPPVIGQSFGYTSAREQVTAAIDANMVVSDPNNATLSHGRAEITTGFNPTQDVLSFTNTASMGNITGTVQSGGAAMVLTSAGATATIAQWQAAFRGVMYTNTSDTPDTTLRQVTFIVNDGGVDSAPSVKGMTVSAVNDAPVLNAPATLTAPIGQPVAITGITTADIDSGASNIHLSLSEASGDFTLAPSPNVSLDHWEATATHYVSGTPTNINAYVAAGNITYTSIAESPSSYPILVKLDDGGATGQGGNQVRTAEIMVTKTVSDVDEWSLY